MKYIICNGNLHTSYTRVCNETKLNVERMCIYVEMSISKLHFILFIFCISVWFLFCVFCLHFTSFFSVSLSLSLSRSTAMQIPAKTFQNKIKSSSVHISWATWSLKLYQNLLAVVLSSVWFSVVLACRRSLIGHCQWIHLPCICIPFDKKHFLLSTFT